MRCAIIEADVREEVMREMEVRMASMEKMYARRLMSEVDPSCRFGVKLYAKPVDRSRRTR
jgi:hypothetical protein